MTRIYSFIILAILCGCTKPPVKPVLVDTVYHDVNTVPPSRPIRIRPVIDTSHPQIELHRVVVYFKVNSDSADIKGLTTRLMRDYLSLNPSARFIVSGYADTTGSTKYNQSLSERRARTLVRTLVSLGVDAAHVTGIGYGELPGPLDKSRKVTITINP